MHSPRARVRYKPPLLPPYRTRLAQKATLHGGLSHMSGLLPKLPVPVAAATEPYQALSALIGT
jgi:hypothetical protein